MSTSRAEIDASPPRTGAQTKISRKSAHRPVCVEEFCKYDAEAPLSETHVAAGDDTNRSDSGYGSLAGSADPSPVGPDRETRRERRERKQQSRLASISMVGKGVTEKVGTVRHESTGFESIEEMWKSLANEPSQSTKGSDLEPQAGSMHIHQDAYTRRGRGPEWSQQQPTRDALPSVTDMGPLYRPLLTSNTVKCIIEALVGQRLIWWPWAEPARLHPPGIFQTTVHCVSQIHQILMHIWYRF